MTANDLDALDRLLERAIDAAHGAGLPRSIAYRFESARIVLDQLDGADD